MRKFVMYLLRAAIGFYFIYPALLMLTGVKQKLAGTAFACLANGSFSPTFVFTGWNVFLIILGLMIAFWYHPLTWIILGIVIIILKIYTSVITLPLLLQTVPVLLVAVGLLIYYGKEEFGNRY